MTKAELIVKISESTGVSKKDTESVINSFTAVIGETLAKKEEVVMVGFGSFKPVVRAARETRKPGTTEVVKVAAKTVPVFKAGKLLKEKVA